MLDTLSTIMWVERIVARLAPLDDDELFDITDLLVTCRSLTQGQNISDQELQENEKFYQSPLSTYGYKFNRNHLATKLTRSNQTNADMILICETKIKYLNEYAKGKNIWSELLQVLKALRKIQIDHSRSELLPVKDFADAWAKSSHEFIRISEDTQFGELRKLRRGPVVILITVGNNGEPTGVITESTLGNPASKGKIASEIAVRPIIMFRQDDLMSSIYERLCQNNYEKPIRQVVVVQADGSLLGIVSTEHANRWKDGETPE